MPFIGKCGAERKAEARAEGKAEGGRNYTKRNGGRRGGSAMRFDFCGPGEVAEWECVAV